MKELAIYGAGGFGREVALLVDQINETNPTWNLRGFFDDGLSQGLDVDEIKVLGGALEARGFNGSIAIAVADPAVRESIVTNLGSHVTYATLVHPSAQLGALKFNEIGRGSIITAGVILTTGIRIGNFCILNLLTSVGHDVTIGDFSTIMPGCSISGNVSIGSRCLLGTGSRLLQQIEIGKQSVVGAGAVVTKSFPSGAKLMGVPAVNKS